MRVALVDVVGADPAGDVVRAALARTGIHHVLRTDPLGTKRSVNMVDPQGRRMSLFDPRGAGSGPPPFDRHELAELTRAAAHVHVSIMDWSLALLPTLRDALAAPAAVSTELHDWDGANDHHRPFLAAADLVFVSGVALGEHADAVVRELIGWPRPRTVLVTHGARGAVLAGTDAPAVRIPATTPPLPVTDTNGAGDAFAAGFIAARLRGLPPVKSAGYAARVAAAACTHDGMDYPPHLLPRA